jgi:hypothetical protein
VKRGRIYSPWDETRNLEQIRAAHWELLRRNQPFQSIAARWCKSPDFRLQHCLTSNYHNMQVHYQRCALDWMLSPTERLQLAEHQIVKLHWFRILRFNFGPIKACYTSSLLGKTSAKAIREALDIQPMHMTGRPICLDQNWSIVPAEFQQQFGFACIQPSEVSEITPAVQQAAALLRRVGHILARKELSRDELLKIAHDLARHGDELREMGEFNKIFSVPVTNYSRKGFESGLARIWTSFRDDGRIDSERKYNLHKSYLGTKEQWRWFLESEATSQRAAALKFAREKAKSQVWDSDSAWETYGQTIRRSVEAIEKWIARTYPPGKDSP